MMPAFDRLFKKEVDWSRLESRVRALAGLNGADGEEARSVDAEARSEGRAVFARLVAEDESYGERELAETKAMALTAYLLRLGEASYGPE